MEILWLIVFAGLIILELSTTQFVCIWFAGGALASFISALCNTSVAAQAIVFIAVSSMLLIFTKKFVSKLKSKPNIKTNADALIGQSAIVTEDISNIRSKGSVKIRGLEWSARSFDGSEISADSYVTVKDIDGVKLIVDKISQ